jgi:uncharacterized protein YecE (DUF72 family)
MTPNDVRRGVLVGTSGWQYADWRGPVYPTGVPQRRWLEEYATRFRTVEVNNSFYRLPTEETFERWAASTPADFVFSVKASRYLTHVRRLRAPREPARRLLRAARHLGPKLGVVLLQLPPRFRCDAGRLASTLDAFGTDTKVAVEVRDERWHADAVYEVLEARNAALVWWDRRGVHGPLVRTADWAYVRFHEGRAHDRPSYGRRALATWCERLASSYGTGADAWVYFNNDPGAAAPEDAARFSRLLDASGFAVAQPASRTASPSSRSQNPKKPSWSSPT